MLRGKGKPKAKAAALKSPPAALATSAVASGRSAAAVRSLQSPAPTSPKSAAAPPLGDATETTATTSPGKSSSSTRRRSPSRTRKGKSGRRRPQPDNEGLGGVGKDSAYSDLDAKFSIGTIDLDKGPSVESLLKKAFNLPADAFRSADLMTRTAKEPTTEGRDARPEKKGGTTNRSTDIMVRKKRSFKLGYRLAQIGLTEKEVGAGEDPLSSKNGRSNPSLTLSTRKMTAARSQGRVTNQAFQLIAKELSSQAKSIDRDALKRGYVKRVSEMLRLRLSGDSARQSTSATRGEIHEFMEQSIRLMKEIENEIERNLIVLNQSEFMGMRWNDWSWLSKADDTEDPTSTQVTAVESALSVIGSTHSQGKFMDLFSFFQSDVDDDDSFFQGDEESSVGSDSSAKSRGSSCYSTDHSSAVDTLKSESNHRRKWSPFPTFLSFFRHDDLDYRGSSDDDSTVSVVSEQTERTLDSQTYHNSARSSNRKTEGREKTSGKDKSLSQRQKAPREQPLLPQLKTTSHGGPSDKNAIDKKLVGDTASNRNTVNNVTLDIQPNCSSGNYGCPAGDQATGSSKVTSGDNDEEPSQSPRQIESENIRQSLVLPDTNENSASKTISEPPTSRQDIPIEKNRRGSSVVGEVTSKRTSETSVARVQPNKVPIDIQRNSSSQNAHGENALNESRTASGKLAIDEEEADHRDDDEGGDEVSVRSPRQVESENIFSSILRSLLHPEKAEKPAQETTNPPISALKTSGQGIPTKKSAGDNSSVSGQRSKIISDSGSDDERKSMTTFDSQASRSVQWSGRESEVCEVGTASIHRETSISKHRESAVCEAGTSSVMNDNDDEEPVRSPRRNENERKRSSFKQLLFGPGKPQKALLSQSETSIQGVTMKKKESNDSAVNEHTLETCSGGQTKDSSQMLHRESTLFEESSKPTTNDDHKMTEQDSKQIEPETIFSKNMPKSLFRLERTYKPPLGRPPKPPSRKSIQAKRNACYDGTSIAEDSEAAVVVVITDEGDDAGIELTRPDECLATDAENAECTISSSLLTSYEAAVSTRKMNSLIINRSCNKQGRERKRKDQSSIQSSMQASAAKANTQGEDRERRNVSARILKKRNSSTSALKKCNSSASVIKECPSNRSAGSIRSLPSLRRPNTESRNEKEGHTKGEDEVSVKSKDDAARESRNGCTGVTIDHALSHSPSSLTPSVASDADTLGSTDVEGLLGLLDGSRSSVSDSEDDIDMLEISEILERDTRDCDLAFTTDLQGRPEFCTARQGYRASSYVKGVTTMTVPSRSLASAE